jgi:hypothetical protein
VRADAWSPSGHLDPLRPDRPTPMTDFTESRREEML